MKNKVLLKVAYIIGFISGIIECITVVGAILGIPTIILSYQLKKYYEMKDSEIDNNKDKLFTIIIIQAFISPLSGILALVYYIGLERKYLKKLEKKHTK